MELSQPSTFNNNSDFVSFLTSIYKILILRIRKHSLMSGFPWTNPSVNSLWYTKKWVLQYGWGSIIMTLACNIISSTPQGSFRVFQMRFSLSVSSTCLVICKSTKKWYLMRMCTSWLCPFKDSLYWLGLSFHFTD